MIGGCAISFGSSGVGGGRERVGVVRGGGERQGVVRGGGERQGVVRGGGGRKGVVRGVEATCYSECGHVAKGHSSLHAGYLQ